MHVDVHTNARDDLGRLQDTDPDALAAILAVLGEINADPDNLDKLTTYGNNPFGASRVNVKPWEAARGQGNLWRFRALDTPATNYRIVYGYHYQTRQLCVLAVVHKEEFDYELDSEIGTRIMADWRALG